MSRGKKQRRRERRAKENEKKELTKLVNDNVDSQLVLCVERPSMSMVSIFKNEELQEISSLLGVPELNETHSLLGAIALGKFDLIKKLLKNGFSIEGNCETGVTPFLWAVKLKQIKVIDFFLRRNANVNVMDKDENNSILLALQTNNWNQELFVDFWNIIKYTNIDLNHCNKAGNSALHYAVKRQWDIVLDLLLSNPKVNINVLTKKGVSALMMACSRHQESTISILLKHNANVFIEDERACTALCYAIAYLMQKKFAIPNKIIDTLMDIITYSESMISLEGYVQRRLDLIINPPTGNYSNTISSILIHIINFFTRFVPNGLDMLVAMNVFKKLKIAIEKNLENLEYCLCLFAVISVVISGPSQGINNITKDGLIRSYYESNILPLLLRFIKRNDSGSLETKNFYLILRPIFQLSSNSLIKKWLQRNFKALATSCNYVLSSSSSSPQLCAKPVTIECNYTDDVHGSFNSFINQLLHVDIVSLRDEKVDKIKKKDMRSHSVDKPNWNNKGKNKEIYNKDTNLITESLNNYDETTMQKTMNNLKEDGIKKLEELNCTENVIIGDGKCENDWINDIIVEQEENQDLNEKFNKDERNVAPSEELDNVQSERIRTTEMGGGDIENYQNGSITIENKHDNINNNNFKKNKTNNLDKTRFDDNRCEMKLYFLDNLVKCLIKSYEDVWIKEYIDLFMNNKMNKDVYRLKQVLPQLERYYICHMKSSWTTLIDKLKEQWRKNSEEALTIMDQVEIYLFGYLKLIRQQNLNDSTPRQIFNHEKQTVNENVEILKSPNIVQQNDSILDNFNGNDGNNLTLTIDNDETIMKCQKEPLNIDLNKLENSIIIEPGLNEKTCPMNHIYNSNEPKKPFIEHIEKTSLSIQINTSMNDVTIKYDEISIRTN